ncbi:MAG: hypothetical protein GC204_10375 [Chloroflexi bacterium]|nr:hypothetical protein [Chloroflexota bacterium]
MENNSATATQRRNPACSCTLLMFAILILATCLVVAWLKGVPNDVLRWVKSFEFPAIEARYTPITDQFVTITSDTRLDQSRSIGNTGFMTNNDFTGVVAGDITQVFGTNREVERVLNDYVRFFSALPGWRVDQESETIAYATDHTAKVIIRVRDNNDVPFGASGKYQTIYEISLIYGDPRLWEP